MRLRLIAAATLALLPAPALARTIVLTNDDGLTSNVVALYHALKEQGHDVIVSVPCTGQSGMGGALYFMRPLGPLAADCLHGAAKAGDPGAGPMTRPGLGPDFHYVSGTPVMALLHGIDIVAARRWGKAPDLVLSGPNEGQNVGFIVVTSGTVSNAQYAASRGIPAVALSAGHDTTGDEQLANPKSAQVAALSAKLVQALDSRAKGGAMLPPGIALNVNLPDRLEGARWRPSRIGTYNSLEVRFTDDVSASPAARARGIALPKLPGISVDESAKAPRADQMDDETVVYRRDIAVSPMQVAYDHGPAGRQWLRRHLRGLLER